MADSDPTVKEIVTDRFTDMMNEAREKLDTKSVRALLGMAVLEHLLDDHEPPEIPAAMELFFTEVRVRVQNLTREP